MPQFGGFHVSKRSPDIVGVFVHESAYVDEPCEIGGGTKIWHLATCLKTLKSAIIVFWVRMLLLAQAQL